MPAGLCITRGYPGSGKTTWAQQQVAEDRNVVRVNRDDMRRDIFGGGGRLTHEDEVLLTKLQQDSVTALLRAGRTVIVDDTNLRLRFARNWANLAAKEGVPFQVVDFTPEVSLCIERDRERIWGHVGRKVIEEKAARFPYGGPSWATPEADLDTKASGVEVYDNHPCLDPAIIVDIDGTLANHEGVRSPYDYTKVSEDAVHHDVVSVVDALADQWGCAIIVVSGREGTVECRQDTERWLREEAYVYPDALFMRAPGDKRSDDIVKHEIFQEFIAGNFHIKAVLDDRDRVVAMWRALGLRTLQVAPGAF